MLNNDPEFKNLMDSYANYTNIIKSKFDIHFGPNKESLSNEKNNN
jgi:hypothetical protein